MRLLADTHAVLWWMRGDPRLSARAAEILEDGATAVLWSIASSWELAVKVSAGKLQLDPSLERFLADVLGEQGLQLLGVTQDHCTRLATMPPLHRDPFDRMLVSQAQLERMPLLTSDGQLARYEVELIW